MGNRYLRKVIMVIQVSNISITVGGSLRTVTENKERWVLGSVHPKVGFPGKAQRSVIWILYCVRDSPGA